MVLVRKRYLFVRISLVLLQRTRDGLHVNALVRIQFSPDFFLWTSDLQAWCRWAGSRLELDLIFVLPCWRRCWRRQKILFWQKLTWAVMYLANHNRPAACCKTQQKHACQQESRALNMFPDALPIAVFPTRCVLFPAVVKDAHRRMNGSSRLYVRQKEILNCRPRGWKCDPACILSSCQVAEGWNLTKINGCFGVWLVPAAVSRRSPSDW